MTPEEITATKDAIEVLRLALKRVSEGKKYGPSIEHTMPLWNAANFLMCSLPRNERY